MEAVNWAPVSIVLAVMTGIAVLAMSDLLQVSVVAGAFAAGFATGRLYPLRHPSDPSRDGGNRE